MERSMTAETQSTNWIQRSLAGDLSAFSYLLERPELVLEAARTPSPDRVLTAEGVRKVLVALQRRMADPDLVQHWASFMRRGYIGSAHRGPIQPIDILLEPAADAAITEILSRLDEIGDTIDGEVGSNEVAEMLTTLPLR
jgi:hypothetical protein